MEHVYRVLRFGFFILRPLPHFFDWGQIVISLVTVLGGSALLATALSPVSGVLAAFGGFLLLSLIAGYRLLSRVEPRLCLESSTAVNMGGISAVLRVRNSGSERLEECYGRIALAIVAVGFDGSIPIYRRLFSNENIYLQWRGGQASYTNLHTEAVLEVVTYGSGNFSAQVASNDGSFYSVGLNTEHFLSVEAAAQNSAAVTRPYRLVVQPSSLTGLGPTCEFSEVKQVPAYSGEAAWGTPLRG